MTVEYSSVRQLLRLGEKALAIFTDGRGLSPAPSAIAAASPAGVDGESASWSVDPLRRVDWIILYLRIDRTEGGRLLLCRPGDLRAHGDGRYTLGLRQIHEIGTTARNWPDFADTGQRELRYVER
jgi:hypothetical protein